jgi:hypothetical protein
MYTLRAPRLNGLMEVKGFERKHLVALGLQKPAMVDKWRAGTRGASVSDALRIAAWLDVCIDYLWGAPNRYDKYQENYTLVAIYASLDTFLDLTLEGQSTTDDIKTVLYEIASKPGAPVKRERWLATWRDVTTGVQHGELRAAAMERMVRQPPISGAITPATSSETGGAQTTEGASESRQRTERLE